MMFQIRKIDISLGFVQVNTTGTWKQAGVVGCD